MNELSLFTGAGGGILGSILLGWRTVGYVEIDPYCQAVIRQRQIDGIYDDAPIFGDIRQFDGKPWRGCVDIVTAGFPCQPFSVAGKRAGADDERNMWPETLRIISEVRPRYAFLENVPGLISAGYLGIILGGLAESGYDAEWCVLGAHDVGAPHRRNRLWILAYPTSERCGEAGDDGKRSEERFASSSIMADSDGAGRGKRCGAEPMGAEQLAFEHRSKGRITWWDTDPADVVDPEMSERGGMRTEHARRGASEAGRSSSDEGSAQPLLGRMAYGIPRRVDRLKAIGNGQVPAVVRAAWYMLSEGLTDDS